MDIRKTPDGTAFGLMFIICISWALQQVLIKATAFDAPPTLQIALRLAIACVLVALLMRHRGERMTLSDGTWRPGLLAGLAFGLEFLFIGEGLRYTNASHMTVFLYAAPFVAAVGLHWRLPEERLAPMQWLGIVLAFVGLAVAFLGPTPPPGTPQAPNIPLGDLLGLLAGVMWGGTTVLVRCTSLSSAPPTKTLQYQLVVSTVLLLIITWYSGQFHMQHTWSAWGSILFQGVLVSFLSLLGWFWLLRTYLASILGAFTFVTPLLGVVFGGWLLDEPLDPSFLAGALLVAVGIVLVSGYGWLAQRWAGVTARRG